MGGKADLGVGGSVGRCGIHSRDDRRQPASSKALVQISKINLMLRRLAEEKCRAPFRFPRPELKIAA